MNKKIFRSTCIVAIVVLLASMCMIMGVLTSHFESQIEKELKSEAQYISHAIENEGIEYFDALASERRITLIQSDGKVLYDTDADSSGMENHLDREEIREAIETGTGTSSRYSKTLTQKTVYYAILLDNGDVLRVSTTQYTLGTLLLAMIQPICIIVLIAIVLSAVLASRVAKSILAPINNLDLDNPEDNQTYDEINPLLYKLSQYKIQLQLQLREAEKKQEEFCLITENMSEGFLIIDINTNLLTYNTAALKLLGISEAGSGSVLRLNRSRDFRMVVDGSLTGERMECTMNQNGRTYQLISNPVYEMENVIGAVIVILDVTERTQREEMRREFSANVSHELKTPLTSISGFAELMRDGNVAEADVKDFSSRIYMEARRLITLVSDIIKLGQLDEGKSLYETESVDLYTLSKDICLRLEQEAAKTGVQITVSGESTKINGVRQMLDEMIFNLCDNAIKYNKPNGTVKVVVGKDKNNVELTVQDTGIGIPPESQDRVFERFYRVDKSHSKEVGGTGLGLAIVKHGAAYHNAEIRMSSTENEGTTVKIIFKNQEQS